MPSLADVRNFLSMAKDGVVEAGSRTKNDTYRVASTTREALVTGSANTDEFTRRDLLKAAGASAGLVLTGAYGDDLYSKIEEAVPDDATKSDGAWYSGPDPLNLGNHRAAEGISTRTGTSSSQTPDDQLEDYQDFVEGLGQLEQGDIRYLHRALDEDPGIVENVVTDEPGGIRFDSTVLEKDQMSREMSNYLESAAETGELEGEDGWLAKYEESL